MPQDLILPRSCPEIRAALTKPLRLAFVGWATPKRFFGRPLIATAYDEKAHAPQLVLLAGKQDDRT
jgi:hypothetical protein